MRHSISERGGDCRPSTSNRVAALAECARAVTDSGRKKGQKSEYGVVAISEHREERDAGVRVSVPPVVVAGFLSVVGPGVASHK